jgi:hypothetical protein
MRLFYTTSTVKSIRITTMTIYLSIDDTDTPDSPGTGRLARTIAGHLAREMQVEGVTRHQLFVHESIPFTSHNSCAVIHIAQNGRDEIDVIFEIARDLMQKNYVEGSDPGIAVASGSQVTPALSAFGLDAKTTVLTQDRARKLARNLGILLEGLGGSEDGVIGALAGLSLAASGNDGRFVQKGKIRDFFSPCRVEDLLNAGIDAVFTLDGVPVISGTIMAPDNKSVKPCLIHGAVILLVGEQEGTYYAVKRD